MCFSLNSGNYTVRDLCESALVSALMLVLQVGLAGIPNVELVTTVLMSYAVARGKKAIPTAVCFSGLEILVWGFGVWNIMYLYIWIVLVLICMVLRLVLKRSVIFRAVISALYGLLFGAICAVVYIPISGIAFAVSWWVSGLSFDILHCVSNFVCTFCLSGIFLRIFKAVEV